MQKPRKPKPNAFDREWDNYFADLAKWREGQRTPRQIQHRDDDVTVRVGSGYSVDHDGPTSDFIIAEHGVTGHIHLVLDENGETIYDERNPNR